MNNEQYDQIAKDFCIANGFDTASFRRFVKFAKDLIDKGVLVEAENQKTKEIQLNRAIALLNEALDKIGCNQKRENGFDTVYTPNTIEGEFCNEVDDFLNKKSILQSTLSSAGKEVRIIPTYQQVDEYAKRHSTPFDGYKSAVDAAIWVRDQFKSSPASTEDLFGTHEAWPLTDVLLKLIESTEYLLNVKDYDRTGWEDVSYCTKIGREYLSKITEALSNMPASTVKVVKEK